MKVHKNLIELLDAYQSFLLKDEHERPVVNRYERPKKFLKSNSLVLGKPEPLRKNKQTERIFFCTLKANYIAHDNECTEQCKSCSGYYEKYLKDATSR